MAADAEIHKQAGNGARKRILWGNRLDAAQRAADLYRQCGDCAEAKRGIALAREEADRVADAWVTRPRVSFLIAYHCVAEHNSLKWKPFD